MKLAKLPTDWTPDAVTDLLKGSGDLQKKFLRYLYEQDSVVTSTQIVKALKLQSEVAFAGVLSGLSKRLKKTQLQPGDLYSVTVQWTNEGKIRRFTISSGFRWAAEQLGWPNLDLKFSVVSVQLAVMAALIPTSRWAVCETSRDSSTARLQYF